MSTLAGFDPSDFAPSLPEISANVSNIRTPFNAGGELFAEALEKWVRKVEAGLDDSERLQIVGYHRGGAIQVRDVAFPSARTLVLMGVDGGGNRTHVFSHVSAVQLAIRVIPKQPEEKRRPIGFHHPTKTEEEETEQNPE